MSEGSQNGVPVSVIAALAKFPPDADAGKAYPKLMELLRPVWVDNKCKRQSGSLTLRLTGGFYVVTIRCPTEGVEANFSTETLITLFDELEKAILDHNLRWFPDYESQKKTRRVRIDEVKS